MNIEEPDLFDDEPTNNKTLSFVLEENDYLDKEVGYILELVRYTCEMLGIGIPQRKNSERDIDMLIKRHIFACFDDILDTHLDMILEKIYHMAENSPYESDSTHHFELGKFDIPTSYDEIWKLTKIARIMLQIKKLLRYTVSRFKRIIERAEKEKFLPGKVTIIKIFTQ
ncbi:hypothetical protein GLOIN_2v1485939 [Rhizophagus irregularis DAOM 181602=DAOM 197198]|uniref:Uncharacterized protein n=1 Tax=Rhizophagus irregularis (strain DAOM 181602 / DAOM 197198 / MUCL 43194) TaxID=747089 RepID=A0A2P4P8V5_RHIID|nr:hypothetical protein GLOIN_2v1485939 [Rhizophagus irregularis DAOM 181602=DAOM 197198]POG61818.1 hypothetical protein GLOIN_2v1485939 [Rhizophagus irregularis DAOM 181602=DAOM 197198]|eukprot:XP_025168684.1 hypothetical protein GLOIN_2v1485939 [Rhizophagus irregularis DAOM 181602=DAOM 197198]